MHQGALKGVFDWYGFVQRRDPTTKKVHMVYDFNFFKLWLIYELKTRDRTSIIFIYYFICCYINTFSIIDIKGQRVFVINSFDEISFYFSQEISCKYLFRYLKDIFLGGLRRLGCLFCFWVPRGVLTWFFLEHKRGCVMDLCLNCDPYAASFSLEWHIKNELKIYKNRGP